MSNNSEQQNNEEKDISTSIELSKENKVILDDLLCTFSRKKQFPLTRPVTPLKKSNTMHHGDNIVTAKGKSV